MQSSGSIESALTCCERLFWEAGLVGCVTCPSGVGSLSSKYATILFQLEVRNFAINAGNQELVYTIVVI